MSAAAAIRLARENGIRLGISGDELILDATTKPPNEVIETIRNHKADIVALLSVSGLAWDSEDWLAFYGERAGIGEFDAGLARDRAENMAFEQCVLHYLALNKPPAGESGCCLHCGQPAGPDSIPTTCATELPGFIHLQCNDEWGKGRREQAVATLANFGITSDRR